MLILISQVAVGYIFCITLALIEGHLQHSHHLVLAISGDGLQTGEATLLDIPHIDEIAQQLSLIPTDARYQGDFRQTLHCPIAIEIIFDVLHLRGGEERQPLQVLAGSDIQVDGMLGIILQFVFIVFPVDALEVFLLRDVLQEFLPRHGLDILGERILT